MRSPFFKAAMSNDMLEKRKKIISVKELDPKVMQQVIDYMHGIPNEVESIHCLPDIMEAVDRFLMADMKNDVTDIAIKSITMENVVELGKLAEENSMDKILKHVQNTLQCIAENDVKFREELTPKFANTLVSILQKSIKKSGNMKGKRHLRVHCDGCGLKPLVGFRYKCVTCDDYDLCGNCESAGIHPEHNMVRIASPDPHHKMIKTDNHDYDTDLVLYAVRK